MSLRPPAAPASPHPPAPGPPAAVVIPVRSFASGKSRLAPHLDVDGRAGLLAAMAERVVAAARPLPTVVVSNAPEVVSWAGSLGLPIIADPGSLDGAAAAGLAWAAGAGFERVVIAHADLPLAETLEPLALFRGRPIVCAVPCHRGDGTTVLSVPTGQHGFTFAYGPGSFRRHAEAARRAGLAFRVHLDPRLRRDVDDAGDLVGLAFPGAPAACRPA